MNEPVTNPDPDLVRRLGLELRPRRFWTRGKAMLAGLVVLALAAGIGVYFWRSDRPTAYVTASVSRGPLIVPEDAHGTPRPQDKVEVGAQNSVLGDSGYGGFH